MFSSSGVCEGRKCSKYHHSCESISHIIRFLSKVSPPSPLLPSPSPSPLPPPPFSLLPPPPGSTGHRQDHQHPLPRSCVAGCVAEGRRSGAQRLKRQASWRAMVLPLHSPECDEENRFQRGYYSAILGIAFVLHMSSSSSPLVGALT